jgi:membrane-associated PAP2 superfamily phosphatase
MLNTHAPNVNTPDAPSGSLLRMLFHIALACTVALATIWVLGLDWALANALHNPESTFARATRSYGAFVTGLMAFACLPVLFWPSIHKRNPLLYRTAAVVVLTAVLGTGLINQVIVKQVADRPRPRDTMAAMMADQPIVYSTEFRGNSMPSGHAGQAFVLMAPFFVLRRSRRTLANAALGIGALAGAVVGTGRMVAGAHYISDVIVAGGIVLLTAATVAWWLERRNRAIPVWWVIVGALIGLSAIVLGNKFKVDLVYDSPRPWRAVDVPCPLTSQPADGITHPVLHVRVNGYGAPLSQLKLAERKGTVKLHTGIGLFHSMSCEGTILLPAN